MSGDFFYFCRMGIILFDDNAHYNLRPLTFTRPVAGLRVGILTIAEKWSKCLNAPHSFLTQPYLQGKFSVNIENENIFINGTLCPDEFLLEAIDKLNFGEALKYNDILAAVKLTSSDAL